MYRHIQMARGLLYIEQLPLGRGKAWIQQNPDCARLRRKVAQQPEALGLELCGKKYDPGDVTARPVEACHETLLDRIDASGEDDRDGRSFAAFAACTAGSPPVVAMTATGRRTSSVAIAGNLSYWPIAK